MTSSTSTSSSAAAAAILAAPSSTLSAHAAPFTLRERAPPGRHQDGDDSRLNEDNLLNGAYFGTKLCDTVYPASAHGMHQCQPSSASGIHVNGYPSSASSTYGFVLDPSAVKASDLKQAQVPLVSGKGGNRSKSTKVTIKFPPNKCSKTNIVSFSSTCKLATTTRENDEYNNEAGKDISCCKNLEFCNTANDSSTSQGTTIFSIEQNPVFSMKPICIPSACACSCVSAADDMNPDPSECSVDSPCWQGASASRVSPFDVPQTSAGQSIKQDTVELDAGGEQSSSAVQNFEPLTELQSLVASKIKQNHSHLRVEFGLPKKPGDIATNMAKDSRGKELELAIHGEEKCTGEQECCLEVRDNSMKRSGLNTAAPDFIPLSVMKSNTGNGSCSSTGGNVSGILKVIASLSELLRNNYSDDVELEEHDQSLLLSVIENLQSCIHKVKKGPVKGASYKAQLKAHHSQNALPKSVAGKYNGSYTADNGKSIILSNLADSSHLLDTFGKNSLKVYQPSLSNLPKEFSCAEDHSQVLVYKSLWIDAERVNCELKYQLKQARMGIRLESSLANIGGGTRTPSDLCDVATDPSNSYGSTIACQPVLKGHSGARKSQNLLYAGDGIQSGGNNVLPRSKVYNNLPNKIQGEHVFLGLEETGIHRHVHPGLQHTPSRAPGWLNSSTSDREPSVSNITGRDDFLRASCEFGSSDWEHVLKDEIA